MYPYTRDWFPNFRTDAIKIYSDENMKAHVITVIQAIQMLVDHSFDSDTLIALVEKMARMHLHKSVTTIEVEIFWKCFLRQMKIAMGGRFNSKREKAWARFLALHNKIYRQVEDQWLEESDQTMNNFEKKLRGQKSFAV
ncbi:hypothetical protein RRG08_056325 [Elysia crispata]|uniref:Globin n=1 Tax=Elysia crispata TaxID=231223 RepID=A0AAE0YPV0_9GAST|nr:hypothetical protein RRG08_056325 [Elysia crispata]